MRPRFLALVAVDGAAPDPGTLARLRALLPVEKTAGAVRLFLQEATDCIECGHAAGWIVGTLFARSTGRRITTLSSAQSLALESTRGENLLRDSWGSYAALWDDPRHGVALLRDPSGALPVYRTRVRGLHLVTSDIGLLTEAGLWTPELDWTRVRHGLLYAQLPTTRSHFADVDEVLPGVRMTLSPHPDQDGTSTLLWKPWTFAPDAPSRRASPDDAQGLAAVIDASVAAWAARYPVARLELSGGLDSSIVAAALARAGARFDCVTIASPGPDGDERAHARAVADHVGAPLLELRTTPVDATPFACLPRWTPRPRGMRVLAGLDRTFAALAEEAKADAIFSGGGGDNVFCFTKSTAPVLDALAAFGPRAGAQAARDVAGLTRTTLAQVYGHAARRWLADRRGRRWPADRTFLTPAARCPPDQHPWLVLPREAASGTRAHIGAIVRIHDILDAHQRAADRTLLFPLLSQPVMEYCLGIPSWHWVEGGRDRVVARDAFANRLPPQIIGRASKGVLGSLLRPAFAAERLAIRDALCDGELAGAGLLDRGAIAAALDNRDESVFARPAVYGRLLELLDAELWVRDMIARGRSHADG